MKTPQQYGIEATKHGIDALSNIGVALSDNRTPIDFLFDVPTIIAEVGAVAGKVPDVMLEASEYSTEELAELGAYALTKIPRLFVQLGFQRK
jgi:hypothetical protein